MSDGHRILVVEDNELNLKLVRDVLSYAGYEVIEARTGEQGVALAAECRPDLVLMDLQLPGIDGIEAMRQLRAESADPGGARGRRHRVRDDGRTESGRSSLASTGMWRSRSVSASYRRRCAASCRRDQHE